MSDKMLDRAEELLNRAVRRLDGTDRHSPKQLIREIDEWLGDRRLAVAKREG
jgi:hypothetical protein